MKNPKCMCAAFFIAGLTCIGVIVTTVIHYEKKKASYTASIVPPKLTHNNASYSMENSSIIPKIEPGPDMHALSGENYTMDTE